MQNLWPDLPHTRLTLDVGGRTQEVTLAKGAGAQNGSWGGPWSPLTGATPARDLSELLALVLAGEPSVDLSAVKIIRNAGGQVREWTEDMRSLRDGKPLENEVKPLAARLADGDRIVVPLKPTQVSLDVRRSGLWAAAHGRVFAEKLYSTDGKDTRQRRLSEILWMSQLGKLVAADLDLSKITIHRLKADGSEEHLPVELTKPFEKWKQDRASDVAREADVVLQWGDVVELGAKPGSRASEMRMLTGGNPEGEFVRDMLSRKVKVTVNLEPPREVTLHSGIMPVQLFVQERKGIHYWGSRMESNPFTAGDLVSTVLKDDYPKLIRTRIHSGEVRQILGRDELEASSEWLRDGDEVFIETR